MTESTVEARNLHGTITETTGLDQRTVLEKSIKQLNRVSISANLGLGLVLGLGLGLIG